MGTIYACHVATGTRSPANGWPLLTEPVHSHAEDVTSPALLCAGCSYMDSRSWDLSRTSYSVWQQAPAPHGFPHSRCKSRNDTGQRNIGGNRSISGKGIVLVRQSGWSYMYIRGRAHPRRRFTVLQSSPFPSVIYTYIHTRLPIFGSQQLAFPSTPISPLPYSWDRLDRYRIVSYRSSGTGAEKGQHHSRTISYEDAVRERRVSQLRHRLLDLGVEPAS